MVWRYEYTPYLLGILAPLLLLIFLGAHGFRNRKSPGAIPFILFVVFSIFWVMANALRLAAMEDAIRIFWLRFETALVLPVATAGLCFVLEYAGLGRWLTRWTTVLLVISPVSFALLIMTNEMHHLVWTRIAYADILQMDLGPAHWGAVAYGYVLSLVHLAVLVRLFTRSPRHRWIAASLILGMVLMRVASFFNISGNNPLKPLNSMVIAANFALLMYTLAFFRMRMLDVVPIARDKVVDRMTEAMIVLDTDNHIADLNETAHTVLELTRGKAIGRPADLVLKDFPELLAMIGNSHAHQGEIAFGISHSCWYHVSISPLIDRHGHAIGQLIWMQDITGQKRIQEQILDHQRTRAMLQERELLARELHDGIGQILAATQFQIHLTSELLVRGETSQVISCLQKLSDMIQEAKDSVRTYLGGVKVLSPSDQSVSKMLGEVIENYSRNYGMKTELFVVPEVLESQVDSSVMVQLHPIIQEALTNVRRHSNADVARVLLAADNGNLSVTIEDDGQGFDIESVSGYHAFGLRSMQGRAESAGGHFEIYSATGKGTRIRVRIPCRKEAA